MLAGRNGVEIRRVLWGARSACQDLDDGNARSGRSAPFVARVRSVSAVGDLKTFGKVLWTTAGAAPVVDDRWGSTARPWVAKVPLWRMGRSFAAERPGAARLKGCP